MLNIAHSESLVVTLLLLLLAAKVMGELMERWGQPAMVGEVLAGILLGPSLLGWVHMSPELKVISDLGVFLLMVVAGIDIQPEEIRNSIRGRSIWIAILGFIIPCIAGIAVGYAFHLEFLITIFLSLCIAITALPVSVRILMDLGKLNTDIGRKIISAAIINDVVSLLTLGVILEVNNNWGSLREMSTSIVITFLKVALLTIILAAAYKLFKKARTDIGIIKDQVDKIVGFLKGKESVFAIVILFVLVFASLTELAGLHFVVGAFFAALLLNKDILGLRNFIKVRNNTNSITMGFLAPVFFAGVGVQFSFGAINNYMLLGIVILVSLISKMAGGYFGGKLARMSSAESLTLGVGLNARGIMELVIANIALNNKFIDLSLFSILVIMGLVTTLMSPYLLKKSFLLTEKN
jgi:Kef-type K+ transport system membrane component KefB